MKDDESPSLRHIRDPHSLMKLAQAIVKRLDRQGSIGRNGRDSARPFSNQR